MFAEVWAWTNKGHFSYENINKLRKLIQAALPEKPADGEDPLVVGRCLFSNIEITGIHGPIFKHRKFLAVLPPA